MGRTTVRHSVVLAGFVVVLISGPAWALPIPLTLEERDFSDLGSTGAATTLLVEPFVYDATFSGTVYSQVFDLDTGDYLYLYQVDNSGPSIVEKLVVFPFHGIDEAGLLTAGEPAGFLVGGLAPAGAAYDAAIPEPTVGWDYPSFLGKHIPAGQHSKVLYLISPNPWELGEAHVIDGGTGIVEVYVAVPEPATVCLLGLAALGILRRPKR